MDWKTYLSDNITSAGQLSAKMHLSEDQRKTMEEILARFPMSVTRYYLDLIDWEDYENDPVFRQCIPSISETDLSGSFDTSGESHNTVRRGVQHKYRQTALVLSTQKCAMYCRHCFRKRLVGIHDQEETAPCAADVAGYVREHREISNVLISGGDAFLNDTAVIGEYLEELSKIPQLDLIRFGTRTPVTFPMRIYEDEELLALLKKYAEKKQIYVVTHFNHPREITEQSLQAVRALQSAGVVIRNQTVLLKGVNDEGGTLAQLMRELSAAGVVPYYIFQCRPVAGVKNQFPVPILRGCEIVEEAKSLLSGQAKCFRYVMSHVTGKIEFVGRAPDGRMILKYHQAKSDADQGRIVMLPLDEGQCWIDRVPGPA